MDQARQIHVEALQRRSILRMSTALQRRRNETTSNSIVQARELAIKRSMFKFWRKKRTRLRADRWRVAMDVKIRTLRQEHDERILHNTFSASCCRAVRGMFPLIADKDFSQTWKDAQLIRAASAQYSTLLLHSCFRIWHIATHQSIRLQAIENSSRLRHDLASKRTVLYKWVKSTALSMTAKDVAEDNDRRVTRTALSKWRSKW